MNHLSRCTVQWFDDLPLKRRTKGIKIPPLRAWAERSGDNGEKLVQFAEYMSYLWDFFC